MNLWSVIHGMRIFAPLMEAQGTDAHIVNTASMAGLIYGMGSYGVTKHGVVALTEAAHFELAQAGSKVKVSVLCPQAVRTAMTAGNEGGVASVDGMIEPEQAVQTVVEALAEERFLVLPHPEVETYIQRKTGDYDRWLRGMRKLNAQYNA